MARLTEWATGRGLGVGQVVCEVGSGLNGKRPKLRRILSDPDVRVIVVEHRDRLARFGVEHLEAALSAQGRRIVVADPGETTDDLVRDMTEVLTSMCARLYGRRGAGSRVMRAAPSVPGPTITVGTGHGADTAQGGAGGVSVRPRTSRARRGEAKTQTPQGDAA
ncbi:hypothetical protein MKOR_18790 [Mycolicibacillus koreensis]|nr:hypothetical protein MKOR_18790 [Mycolicibacillus koreensis]